jgi:hypothetical protein
MDKKKKKKISGSYPCDAILGLALLLLGRLNRLLKLLKAGVK